ncbi:hypothetical protein D1872_315870 [compost metagenome]
MENAIKHGYQGKPLNLYVSFNAREKKIIVSNDGKEMRNKKFGIGLGNLKQRLELLCSGDIFVSDPKRSEFTINLGKCNENIDS